MSKAMWIVEKYQTETQTWTQIGVRAFKSRAAGAPFGTLIFPSPDHFTSLPRIGRQDRSWTASYWAL